MFAQLFAIMVFVTGATGLLGSHLLKALLQQNQPVTALYRSAIPVFEQSHRVRWIKGDVLDIPTLEEALQGVDQVYHCAAIVSFQPGQTQQLFTVNVEGTANVVNACLNTGVDKLVHVSSVAALGRAKRGSAEIDENSHWSAEHNSSHYGKSKYLAEMEVWRGIGEGLSAVIVNPSTILGAGNWDLGSAQLFKSAYNEFPWYTDGVTGFVDVKDVVTAMMLLMNSDVSAERFVLNANNLPYKEVFDMIADCFDKKRPSRKVNALLAGIIWRAEAIKSVATGKKPLLTRETANIAQDRVFFNGQKLLQFFPLFQYTPIQQTIASVCSELKEKYSLR